MEAKKNPRIEVGRNSSLFLAVGLNIMLGLSYFALEYKSYDDELIAFDTLSLSDEFVEDIPITNIDPILPPPPPPPALSETIQVVEDAVEIEETLVESTETNMDAVIEEHSVDVGDVVVEEVEEEIEVPFAVVEQVPIFPGCEGIKDNNELKKCFETKIINHVKEHFKYPETASDLGVSGKVYVFFQVDSKGKIAGVKSRGPDDSLINEAERIVKLLPKMTPAMQRGTPVKVPYSLPIMFKLQE